MIRIRSFLSAILIFLSIFGLAQDNLENAIGYHFDISGEMICDYLDNSYNPQESYLITHSVGYTFSPGCFYTLDSIYQDVWIKKSHKKNFFIYGSERESEFTHMVYPKDCYSFRVGMDSFISVNNFRINGVFKHNAKRNKFLEFMDSFGGVSFYKYSYSNGVSSTIDYYYRWDTSTVTQIFSESKSQFEESFNLVFGELDFLKRYIVDEDFTKNDIPNLIKMKKYFHKYAHDEKIYYSDTWSEVKSKNEATYYGEITLVKDSVFNIVYTDSLGRLLYKGGFTSFLPLIRNGDFIYYYSNGDVRKIESFKDNKCISTTSFYSKSKKHYINKLVANKLYFVEVYTVDGESVLDEDGIGKEVLYDSILGRQIENIFVNHRLNSSSYVSDKGQKIYLTCQSNAVIKDYGVLGPKYSLYTYPEESLKNNRMGISLIRCLVSPSGELESYSFLSSIDEDSDKVVEGIVKSNEIRWKPAIDGEGAVYQEVVIPFSFEIYSKTPYRYNNYYWLNHQMHYQIYREQQMDRFMLAIINSMMRL